MKTALALDPSDDAGRLLNSLTCYEHKFGGWEEDIERNEDGRKTSSRVCRTCGHVQVKQ